MARDRDGSVLDVGRRTRTIPPALRRALEVRDRGCRFPGCGLRFTEGHHVVHWADGGETSLDNLILLCRHHHRLVHEEGWALHLGGRGRKKVPLFVDPGGRFHARARDGGVEAAGAGRGRTKDVSGAQTNGHRLRVVPRRPPPVPDRPAAALAEGNRARGSEPEGGSLRPGYTGEPGIPWRLEARALEALDQAHFGR